MNATDEIKSRLNQLVEDGKNVQVLIKGENWSYTRRTLKARLLLN
jgi:hypothetical protein